MLMLSMFLAAVHWLTEGVFVHMALSGQGVGRPKVYAIVASGSLIVALIGIPILTLATTSVVWMAAWLVHRPQVQRMLRWRNKNA
jgi:hypothetical protein